MEHKEITMERLKARNKTFFEPQTMKFHGDIKYFINHAERILTVKTDRGFAHYQIADNFKLNYINI